MQANDKQQSVKADVSAEDVQGFKTASGFEASAHGYSATNAGGAAGYAAASDGEDAAAQQAQDVAGFSAFVDSVQQGRDLGKKRKIYKKHVNELEKLTQDYDDRRNILDNYDAVVQEQHAILDETSSNMNAALEHVDALNAAIQEKEAALKKLKKANAAERVPYDAAFSDSESALAKAKADFRTAKSMDKESNGYQEGVDAADKLLDAAKAAQRDAKRARTDVLNSQKKAEGAIEDELKRLASDKRKFESQINGYKKTAEKANSRLTFCEEVHSDPAKTEELYADIQQRSGVRDQMQSQLEELSSTHEQSKKASRKVRIGLIVAVVVVVALVVVAFAFLANQQSVPELTEPETELTESESNLMDPETEFEVPETELMERV